MILHIIMQTNLQQDKDTEEATSYHQKTTLTPLALLEMKQTILLKLGEIAHVPLQGNWSHKAQ